MSGTERDKRQAGQDALEELLRHTPARARPPQHTEQSIRAALHAEWRALTIRRKRRRVALATAASVLLALIAGGTLLRQPASVAPPRTLAAVEIAIGTALREAPGAAALRLAPAQELRAGQVVTTQTASRLALRWRDGSSVRLDENTRLKLTPAGEINLLRGQVYIDTAGAAADSPGRLTPALLTPAGRLRHFGTQYMASVAREGTTVTVREGRVQLEGPGGATLAGAGEQLRVDATGSSTRRAVPPHGELWQWTQKVAPPFASDGRSVAEFLDWVGRETGQAIRYDSPDARRRAQQTELRGQVAMEPMRALPVILQTSDLDYEVQDGAILVRPGGSR